MMKTNN